MFVNNNCEKRQQLDLRKSVMDILKEGWQERSGNYERRNRKRFEKIQMRPLKWNYTTCFILQIYARQTRKHKLVGLSSVRRTGSRCSCGSLQLKRLFQKARLERRLHRHIRVGRLELRSGHMSADCHIIEGLWWLASRPGPITVARKDGTAAAHCVIGSL